MAEEGSAMLVEDAREDGLTVFKLRDHRGKAPTSRVFAALNRTDMESNADAVVRHRCNRSRIKVEAYPEICDTFSVTVIDGRVFIPNPREAAKRVKKMRKRTKA
jgi:hypothetical protein